MGGIGCGAHRARAVGTALALAWGLLVAHEAAAGRVRELAREAPPLVLKDGRIAQVGIWAVPFRPKASELDPEVKDELTALLSTLATDCFLTAQVIGHVEPEAARAEEALSAHRLARARAERIHRALVERGLQASAVASVWDWQFVVKEPRVTLWVFRLQEGEDCQGKPLAPAPADARPATGGGAAAEPAVGQSLAAVREGAKPGSEVVQGLRQSAAEATPAPSPHAPPPLGAVRENSEPRAPAPASSLERAAGAPPVPGTRPPPKPVILERSGRPTTSGRAGEGVAAGAARPASEPAARSTTAPADRSAQGIVGREVGTPSAPPASTAAQSVASAPEATPAGTGPRRAVPGSSAAIAPEVRGRGASAEEAGAGPEAKATSPPPEVVRPAAGPLSDTALEIHFEANTSFFPKGTVQRLREFLAALPPSGVIELELEAAMGEAEAEGTAKSDGARRWLAEQRVARITRWLEENAGKRSFRFATRYREDDPARRVVLRVRSGA